MLQFDDNCNRKLADGIIAVTFNRWKKLRKEKRHDPMHILSSVPILCWWIFIAVWALRYSGNKESVHIQSRRDRGAYLWPLLLGILMISRIPALLPPLRPLDILLLPHSLTSFGASAAVSLAGLALAIWARFTLGRDWSAQVTLKRDHALVTNGPYAAIRHPIYTALILLFAGLALVIGTLGAGIGMLLVIWSCWVKLRQEEALMLQQFPRDYPAYMARTKRLLPFLV